VPFGKVVERAGAFNRLADPAWANPLDTSFSRAMGGRWNAPGSVGVLYLNNGVPMARAQVAHKLAGQPFGIEDLDPHEQYDLIEVTVAPARVLDCVSDAGLAAVGLATDHKIGAASLNDGQDGIACRSAAGEELALFEAAAESLVTMTARRPFTDWGLGA
jgi:RES domain-containing protein